MITISSLSLREIFIALKIQNNQVLTNLILRNEDL